MQVAAVTSFRPYTYRSIKPLFSKEKPKRLTPEAYIEYYFDIPFQGTTSAGKPLRRLQDITCPYTGIKIISGSALRGFEKHLLKCKNAKDIVDLLTPYQANLQKTEKSVFAIFKDFSLLNPEDNIENCLQMLYRNCLTKLKLEEFMVLDDVDALSKKLSPETALKLRAKTTRCRQIIIEDDERDTFKRKTFLDSLDEIQPKDNERDIFTTIKNKAHFLPTSGSSRNAFVVKYSRRTQIEAARRIFIASLGTIEHVKPASAGGLNTISNFMLTSANGNRYRENIPLQYYVDRFPEIPVYTQKYIDDIVNVIHNGGLQGNETYPYKIKKRLMEESDGRIMVSLGKYKYTEEEAAQAARAYRNRWK